MRYIMLNYSSYYMACPPGTSHRSKLLHLQLRSARLHREGDSSGRRSFQGHHGGLGLHISLGRFNSCWISPSDNGEIQKTSDLFGGAQCHGYLPRLRHRPFHLPAAWAQAPAQWKWTTPWSFTRGNTHPTHDPYRFVHTTKKLMISQSIVVPYDPCQPPLRVASTWWNPRQPVGSQGTRPPATLVLLNLAGWQ